jgi:hypothetical protein
LSSPVASGRSTLTLLSGIVGASSFFSGHEYLGRSPLAAQHRLSVHQHDDHNNDDEHERVPGLGIRPCWTVHLEVEQGRDEETARAALNMVVRITEIATTPIKNGAIAQELCGFR